MWKTAAAALVILALIPVAALAFIPAARVVIPQTAGVTCLSDQVCVEDVDRAVEAERLYRDAARSIQTGLGPFRQLPRVTFCGTPRCFAWFGGGRDAGRTVATFGIVMAPRGWKDFYVRHEMIHHWQGEQVGMLSHWRLPQWLGEGMAYALSGDPRGTLREPFEAYRRRFKEWNAQRDGQDLADALRLVR